MAKIINIIETVAIVLHSLILRTKNKDRIILSHCPRHNETCPFDKCVSDNQITEMIGILRNCLESNTLNDYLRNSAN